VVWTGKQSIELGLADEMGSAEYVAREVIKAESIVNFSVRENLFDRFTKRVGQVSMSLLFDNDLSFR